MLVAIKACQVQQCGLRDVSQQGWHTARDFLSRYNVGIRLMVCNNSPSKLWMLVDSTKPVAYILLYSIDPSWPCSSSTVNDMIQFRSLSEFTLEIHCHCWPGTMLVAQSTSCTASYLSKSVYLYTWACQGLQCFTEACMHGTASDQALISHKHRVIWKRKYLFLGKYCSPERISPLHVTPQNKT